MNASSVKAILYIIMGSVSIYVHQVAYRLRITCASTVANIKYGMAQPVLDYAVRVNT